jgi:murein L,D-transpeptidase YcbB/YkuD
MAAKVSLFLFESMVVASPRGPVAQFNRVERDSRPRVASTNRKDTIRYLLCFALAARKAGIGRQERSFMTTLARTCLLALCLLASVSCWADEREDRETLRAEVEYLTETGRLSTGSSDIAARALIAEFYEQRDFAPAWTSSTPAASLLAAIRASAADGLNPDDYHRAATALERATRDLVLTDSLARLGYHELFGKVNPYDLDPVWNFSRELGEIEPAAALQAMIDSGDIVAALKALVPRGWFYENLRAALAEYREIEAQGGWPAIPEGPVLKPGTTDDRLGAIARRLAITGDIDPADVTSTRVYEGPLLAAVESFQARHGLDVDGIIGPASLRALNVPVEQRILQLKMSLERARWVMRDLENDFIIVNIAGFRAYLVRDREIAWNTRVQVGTAYRRTPIFRDEMKYLVLNPTWTVPYSIATRDILPQIQRDTGYLANRNFDLKDRSGQIVDPTSVSWSGLGRGTFPYTLVQRPGPDNALGRIKFMFPNEHAVYLHDTPARTLFSRAERAFSSGCIRVEHPVELAEQLLGADGWTRARIESAIDSLETRTVMLSKPLPVLLLYWTAEVGLDGRVNFYGDVYDRDPALAAALEEPFRLDPPRG